MSKKNGVKGNRALHWHKSFGRGEINLSCSREKAKYRANPKGIIAEKILIRYLPRINFNGNVLNEKL
ncbi:MAG: hypothetical protein IH618_12740 [Ignavibacteriaceae bacterium]|nr:hypothetical protein [Ignavibacteriaceae bacterium]